MFSACWDLSEMVKAMKKVAKLDVELTGRKEPPLGRVQERDRSRSASWRILSSIEQKEESKGNQQNVKRIEEYKPKVETALANICGDVMKVSDEHLIPSCSW